MSITIGVRTVAMAAMGAALAAIAVVGFRAVTADAVGFCGEGEVYAWDLP